MFLGSIFCIFSRVKSISAEFFSEYLGKTIFNTFYAENYNFPQHFLGEKFPGIFREKIVRKIGSCLTASSPHDGYILFRDVEHLARLVQLLLPLAAVVAEVAVRHAQQEHVGTRPAGDAAPASHAEDGRPEEHRLVVGV
jgi:hypothetical protein